MELEVQGRILSDKITEIANFMTFPKDISYNAGGLSFSITSGIGYKYSCPIFLKMIGSILTLNNDCYVTELKDGISTGEDSGIRMKPIFKDIDDECDEDIGMFAHNLECSNISFLKGFYDAMTDAIDEGHSTFMSHDMISEAGDFESCS
jgi:hypothetical protein